MSLSRTIRSGLLPALISLIVSFTWPSGVGATSSQWKPVGFVQVGANVLFLNASNPGGNQLWETNGTAAGTHILKAIRGASALGELTAAGTEAYFISAESAGGSALWKSNGTLAGTVLVRGFHRGLAGSTPSSLTATNGTVYFVTYPPSSRGNQVAATVWASGGTRATTRVLHSYPTKGSSTQSFASFGKWVYFAATTDSAGTELWRTDGTRSGTAMVKNIAPGRESSSPHDLVAGGNFLYFVASDRIHGYELWRTDGSRERTFMVRNIGPDFHHHPQGSNPRDLTMAGPDVYFAARPCSLRKKRFCPGSLHRPGQQLWKTNGSASGTVMVKRINHHTNPNVDELTVLPSPRKNLARPLILFNASDGRHHDFLWRSDGTSKGTYSLKALSLRQSSYPHDFVPLTEDSTSRLLFAATNTTFGDQLWETNGTPSGTIKVMPIHPVDMASVTLSGQPWAIFQGTSFNGQVALWKSDGSVAGTQIIRPRG